MIGSLNPAIIFHRMVQGSVRSYMVKSKPHGPSTILTMTQTTYTGMVTIMPENRKSTWETRTHGRSTNCTMTQIPYIVTVTIMPENGKST